MNGNLTKSGIFLGKLTGKVSNYMEEGKGCSPHRNPKICLVGDSEVGKTCIFRRIIGSDVSADLFRTTLSCQHDLAMDYFGEKLVIDLYDTAGQEKFRSITTAYLKDSAIILMVCDITKKETINSLEYWFEKVKDVVPETVKIIIIVNKSDLLIFAECQKEYIEIDAKWKGQCDRVFLASAIKNEGIAEILERIGLLLSSKAEEPEVSNIPLERAPHENSSCC